MPEFLTIPSNFYEMQNSNSVSGGHPCLLSAVYPNNNSCHYLGYFPSILCGTGHDSQFREEETLLVETFSTYSVEEPKITLISQPQPLIPPMLKCQVTSRPTAFPAASAKDGALLAHPTRTPTPAPPAYVDVTSRWSALSSTQGGWDPLRVTVCTG